MITFGKMSIRRWMNKFSAIQFRKKTDEKRTGTRGRAKSGFFILFICVTMMFSAFSMCCKLISVCSLQLDQEFIEKEKPYILSHGDYIRLDRFEATNPVKAKKLIIKLSRVNFFLKSYPELNLKSQFKEWLKKNSDNQIVKESADKLWERFKTKGISGFAYKGSRNETSWPFISNVKKLLKILGFLSIIAFIALTFINLAGRNEHLGEVEWSMEWLFSFPVPTTSLFMIKVFEYALFSPFQWFIYFPLHTVVFMGLGIVWWQAAIIGFFCALYLSFLLASIKLVCEIWIRLNMSRSMIKNLQALFTLLGITALMSVFFLANARTIPVFIIQIIEKLPFSYLNFPITLPLKLFFGRIDFFALLYIIICQITIPLLCLLIAKKLVSNGLLKSSSVFQGVRTKKTDKKDSKKSIFRGVIGKDLKHLWRDKNHMVQTLFVPLILIIYNLFITPDLLKNIMSEFNSIAVLAFVIGSYTFIYGCFQVLNIEQQSLWLLFTFPSGIKKILKKKIVMWAFIGLVYPTVIIVAGYVMVPFNLYMIPMTFIVFAALFLYAFISGGIGILSTNPTEIETTKRIDPGGSMGYLFLLMIFAVTLYLYNFWNIMVMMFLLSVMVFAIWQKVDDFIPFMLDPTNAPVQKIDLKTGMISVFMFFFLQQVLRFCYMNSSWTLPQQVTASYFTAGMIVILGLCYSLFRQKVKDILIKTGLKSGLAGNLKRVYIFKSFFAGICMSVVGVAYLKIIDVLGLFLTERNMFMENAGKNLSGSFFWVVILYVFLAPFIEEFLFRGIIYQGLRRSASLRVSIVCSAVIFALVHNIVAIIPVFLLGVVTAYFFEKTNWLLPSIIIHMIYNAVIILV